MPEESGVFHFLNKTTMKTILTIFIILSSLSLNAQLNKNIWKASLLQGVAGFADGTNQAYLFHYHGQFGDIRRNEEAWVNKWAKDMNGDPIVGQERFWQSSRALVFTQDFHHLTRFVENRANEGTMLTYAIGHGTKLKKWYWYAADFAIMFMSRSVGFSGSYDVIFK